MLFQAHLTMDPPKLAQPPGRRAAEADALEARLLRVYEECAPGLLNFARACTHEAGAAEEAVQQAFLDLLRAWRMSEPVEQPREWLYRAVQQFFRSASERRTEARGMAEAYRRHAEPASTPDLSEPKRADEVRRRLARVASPREYQIILLRGEGCSYEEIAAILEIHPGTVASTLARALRKVRRVFREKPL